MVYEYFKNNTFVFIFAFILTLVISYFEGKFFKIRKPYWAHLKNAVTTALVSVLCIYLYKMNETKMEIFSGEMK